ETDGITFRTRSDTEVLWQLWRREGKQCIRRLRGMFSFAAYDRHDSVLWLVRDPFGIKPLHLAEAGDGLYFASEIRALHAAGCVKRGLRDGCVVASAAAGANKFDRSGTLYENVFEVPAGCYVYAGTAGIHVKK